MPLAPQDTPHCSFTDRLVHGVSLLLLPGLLTAGRVYAPHVADGPVLCPWHALLDLNCPGCGLTRALCLFATGQWSASIRTNALIVPGIVAGVVIFVRSIIWLLRSCIRRSWC